MVKPVRTWIVVADAAHARIVANEGVGQGVVDVARGTFENEVQRDGEVYADRPGRVHDRAAAGRHAMERPSDVKDQAAAAFARRIAGHLKKQAEAQAFDRLVLIAAPAFLGHLRVALAKQVAGRVHAEIAKDLAQASNDSIARHLQPVLAV